MAKHNADITKEITTETKIGLGVAAGTAVAAGLAAVYLFGTNEGKKHRANLTHWMNDFKKEVQDRLHDLKKVDKDVYFEIVDDVVNRYQDIDEVNAEELMSFAKEMKKHYETVQQEMQKAERGASRSSHKKKPSQKTGASQKKGGGSSKKGTQRTPKKAETSKNSS